MAHIIPPFTAATALEKVKFAQNAWNTMNPEIIAKGTMAAIFESHSEKHSNVAIPVMLAYTTDCIWRNRDQFIRGQEEIKAFLTKKYAKEKGYRLKKELFAFQDNKIVSCKPLGCSLIQCTDH
jgi:nuclear transport factor 2 (NTF2) superfamily protein